MKQLAALLTICACALAGAAHAQAAALSGILGSKALLVVNGGPPKSVGVGETYQGVKLLSIEAGQAVVEVGGKQQTLRLGESPVSAVGGTTRIVLQASANGHFTTTGQINGRTVTLMVDTGASFVGISTAHADQMGLKYLSGEQGIISTANGRIPGWKIKLDSVRVGDVDVHNVDAVVSMGSMPVVLLGNSFLNRFQMTRTNAEMVLEKRY